MAHYRLGVHEAAAAVFQGLALSAWTLIHNKTEQGILAWGGKREGAERE